MTDTLPLAHARSLLFAPGNRPERFSKAARSGADAVILDLEDSVPLFEKAAARDVVTQHWPMLQAFEKPLVVRINAITSDTGRSDLEWIEHLPNVAGVMIPKAQSADLLAGLQTRLGSTPILPLVESAAGWHALPSLAAVPGVLRLALGNIDFMADTGLSTDEQESELAPLRFAVAMATRLGDLFPPIDGVTAQIDDAQRLSNDTRRAMRFGFSGKLCIHPRQVDIVHEALAPTQQELSWARKVIAADEESGGNPVQVDGRMVDLPVVTAARRTVARAGFSHEELK